MAIDLNKIRLVFQELSQKPMIARFGKNPNLALDHRDAEQEFMDIIVRMCGDKGFKWNFSDSKYEYDMIVTKKSKDKEKQND